MGVAEVLHMNGGMSDTSYAKNSLLQQKVISMTKPICEEAITNLYSTAFPASLAIADLGCSSGPNTFLVVSGLIEVVDKICKRMDRPSPAFQLFLNDLPCNDFNTIFRALPEFQKEMRKQLGPGIGPCFFTGVPGSFYDRLFPSDSVHFVHSSYSLMWLSQVPEGLEENKGNIYMASNSPPSVLRAYYSQYQRDFSSFLKCRSEEVVAGGRMVLTFLGRRVDDPSAKDCCCIWELLAMALGQMVSQGIIEEEKFDSFNIPQYTPSPLEVKSEVEKEGSFTIDRLECSEVNWNAYADELNVSDEFKDGGYNVAKCIRAVAEPLLFSHFGEAIINEVFSRYKVLVEEHMAKEKTQFVNVTVSLTKRA